MKRLFLLLLLNLPTLAHAQASAEAAQAAARVYEGFFEAMTQVEIDKVVAMFTDDAQLWGTNTTTLATDKAGVDQYFSALRRMQSGQNLFRPVSHSVVELNPDTLLVGGRWEVAAPATSEDFVQMRISMVLVRRDGDWKIAQFHNSRLPE